MPNTPNVFGAKLQLARILSVMPKGRGDANFVLYGTSACHLCDMAEELLQVLVSEGMQIQLEKVDIAESDELFQRYGIRIPVLAHPQGPELGWPFGAEEVRAFVRGET